MALEHILQLHKGVLNSGIVLSMINSIPYLPLSLWISTRLFFLWIVALKFVDFRQVGAVIVSGLYGLI
jgi:hypothetical protein